MSENIDLVLDFLRKNRFAKAEAALRGELTGRGDSNGPTTQRRVADPKEEDEQEGSEVGSNAGLPKGAASVRSADSSREFIVKEIDVGALPNGSDGRKGLGISQPQENNMGDLYPWNFSIANSTAEQLAELLVLEEVPRHHRGAMGTEKRDRGVGTEQPGPVLEQKVSFGRGKGKVDAAGRSEINDQGNSRDKNLVPEKEELMNGFTIKTMLPFPAENPSSSSSYNSTHHENERKEIKKGMNADVVGKVVKGQLDDGNKQYYFEKSLDTDQVADRCFDLQLVGDNQCEELPKLPPVRLKSEDKLVNMNWEEKINHHGSGAKQSGDDHAFMIGSYLDVPIGQEIASSGGRRTVGSSWLSVSQGIAEDTSDLVSGFATIGDDSLEYPNEYWDSDEYDDDDDVGYTRQPIEDETWFLAHEIDYPSDNERATGRTSGPDRHDRPTKDEDDDQSFVEEDSYISGEQYFHGKNVAQIGTSEGPMVHGVPDNDMMAQYDGQLLDPEELNLMHSEPVWQGFVSQNNELGMLGNGKFLNDSARVHPDDPFVEDDQHGSVRSIGVGISSDAADIGSEVRESLIGGSSEGDIEYFNESSLSVSGKRHSQQEAEKKRVGSKGSKHDQINYVTDIQKSILPPVASDVGFSFPPPLHSGKNHESDAKPLWSKKDDMYCMNDPDDCQNGLVSDDMLATWRKKNSVSSVRSSRDEITSDVVRSRTSSVSYDETEDTANARHHKLDDAQEEDTGTTLDDEEAAALQEQVRQIKAQEDEFETFNLKIVHRKNRTGFEEDKNFHVVLNSVIAGRYHVTEFLGSAAFSKAIQAHDLHTGMDVCVKIIKNNKDFFDQSLDEIKLLKYVNKHDPADKYHLLRLYDYFYYREHLLIVCELLKANLYEFQKFNRESGGEVYFTMPRLQSIAIQCLEALQFLHGLGLIHCDLKPENILVKSYSRCEVKVIDLGSSCFETDHLCSYVQSRSYRAPEVILGLPYDKKIDIWSLGCILAELCTGNVLFQNDSPATLLARVIGIIGSIEQAMLAQGRDTYKYFTKNHMLYERNQETNRLEYLIPKKTSLRHRLPMADQGFIEFVMYLLEVNPKKRPSASEALKHPWLSFPYEPISS
ncbi:hypothetical protein QOZ80_3BG0263810 [Eleusine coracana subsp. coracana]|nr:hypothetical protein QOZ80_3BG0263810 [Eleusine coracana subsp. coracana]